MARRAALLKKKGYVTSKKEKIVQFLVIIVAIIFSLYMTLYMVNLYASVR